LLTQRGYGITSQPQKILLDSNAYFRLADNLYPLLDRTYGSSPGWKLCILGGTLHEYNYSVRLRSKFIWVENEKHIEDRQRGKIRLSEDQKTSIAGTKEFMRQTCRDEDLGCSPFDIECLAAAYELHITLVTDDIDLVELANLYEQPVMSSMELMQKMLAEQCITIDDVKSVVAMWTYDEDLPSHFHSEYVRLFGEEPEAF